MRVGCPGGEHIIVPTEVKEHYTSSPKNRKSLTVIETIIADGREALPPFIITPGKKIMENWLAELLKSWLEQGDWLVHLQGTQTTSL